MELLATDENRSAFDELFRRGYSAWTRVLFVFVGVATTAVSMALLDTLYHKKLLDQLGIEFTITSYVQMAMVAAVVAIAGSWLLRIPRIFSKIFRLEGLRINQLEPTEDPTIRKLSVLFSKSGLRAAAGIVVNGVPVILLVSALRIEWFSMLVALGVAAGIVIAAGVFMQPQIGMHDLAVRTILRTKAKISSRLDQPDPIMALVGLQEYQVVASAEKWAIDLGVSIRYATAVFSFIIPLVAHLYASGMLPFLG